MNDGWKKILEQIDKGFPYDKEEVEKTEVGYKTDSMSIELSDKMPNLECQICFDPECKMPNVREPK